VNQEQVAHRSLFIVHCSRLFMQPSLFISPAPTLTVGELLRHLKQVLNDDDTARDVWVRGEVSNFTRASSGHLYFSLKDAEGAVRCVLWKNAATQLAQRPNDGDLVRAHGRVSLYEVRGDLQLYVEELEFDGVGALWKKFEALRARLEQEGLFAAARKRLLPPYPRCIGIVTSETGAALQDMLHILRQRWPLVTVVLCPCPVQGVEAPAQIAQALETLNRDTNVEVIIVARGGGSMEDLWAFNEEIVARAIFASRAPVVSGVGHETDFTIADFVADARAPTPTAAATLVTPDQQDVVAMVRQQRQRLTQTLDSRLTTYAQRLQNLQRVLTRLSPRAQLDRRRQQVDDLTRAIAKVMQHRLQTWRTRLDHRQQQLNALNPLTILARGYAIVHKDGHAITHTHQVSVGDALRVRVSNGEFAVVVKSP
jgi:exodeoxyribonuclease VII large subunit